MTFHPVISFPEPPTVLDLSKGPTQSDAIYTIGRYDEDRSNLYTQELFADRTLHVGIDLGAPAGTPIHMFMDGQVEFLAINEGEGNYGPTVVTSHKLEGRTLYVLWGHLSLLSIERLQPGQMLRPGEIFASIGGESENGGWPPHVHVQLCWENPGKADMPGVVRVAERDDALQKYPDPRLILGSIYSLK